MSSPTFAGGPQLSAAVPSVELPVGLQCTASCCAFGLFAGVFPLLKITTRSPFGSATGSDPWLKSHAFGSRFGSKMLPKKQSVGLVPLISTGFDHVRAPSVDIDP
jgi:hypothetical protein